MTKTKQSPLQNKTILVTGGTGSWGQAFVAEAIKHNPQAIRIFSRGEFLQSEMQKKFPDCTYLIGDVRDLERLKLAFAGVDIVCHAAALKQILACEYSPDEAVKTNIQGSRNVVMAALDRGVEKVMALSTDKAAEPQTHYGKTKAAMESLVTQANSYRGKTFKTRFSCVRYGNVLGSRGSVVPLFKEQAKTGVLTVTHREMTRFWLTLQDGVLFVINCLSTMEGGEIFVPKIASAKMLDLAKAIAPEAKCKFVGIRSSEKIHEVLLTVAESRHSRDMGSFFCIEPEHKFWKMKTDGNPLPEGFSYTSLNNPWKLSVEEIRSMLQ